MLLEKMSYKERRTCALVCQDFAKAARAQSLNIIYRPTVHDANLRSLQDWLRKHQNQNKLLQLHECESLTALPCTPAQLPGLEELLLHGVGRLSIASRIWTDLSAATSLVSVSLHHVETSSEQASVVSALAALPNLEQLAWCSVKCREDRFLESTALLQLLTQLTAFELDGHLTGALEHLGSLTRLVRLSIRGVSTFVFDSGCPGLEQLVNLTSLKLHGYIPSGTSTDIPASISRLTALQQLDVSQATLTALNGLQVLTGLTQLRVKELTGVSAESELQLPGLQHLELRGDILVGRPPMPRLSSCTQLRVLSLHDQCITVLGPRCLVASTMLQRLELVGCEFRGARGATGSFRWQHIFQGPGQLPHLTALHLEPAWGSTTSRQQANMELVVDCCSSLRELHLTKLPHRFARALAGLSGLTSLHLCFFWEGQGGALAKLTGLQELRIWRCCSPRTLASGFRPLSGLKRLTSLGFGCELKHDEIGNEFLELLSDRLPGCLHAIVNKVGVCLKGVPTLGRSQPWYAMQCLRHYNAHIACNVRVH